jgi:hypothetical protein
VIVSIFIGEVGTVLNEDWGKIASRLGSAVRVASKEALVAGPVRVNEGWSKISFRDRVA